MENDRIQAGVHKDVDAIGAVTAEDYVNIDFDGKLRNKADTLERIQSSEIQLQSNTLDEIEVRFYGDTAVVTGRATPKGTTCLWSASTLFGLRHLFGRKA